MGLAVDQLQYSDDLATAILHRKRKQGAGSVPGFLVVMLVEPVWTATRNAISIGEIDDFPTNRRTARQGIFAQREHKFLEGKLNAVVLREHEPKMALRWTHLERIGACLLNEVEGARVGSRDLAGFCQNHVEQRADIASLRQRHADAVQFLHLALGTLEFRAGAAFALGQFDIVERRSDCLANQGGSRLARQRREASGCVLANRAVS